MRYIRPIIADSTAPEALPLAGGWCRFSEVEVLERGARSRRLQASKLTEAEKDRLCRPRGPINGLKFGEPHIMGILNVTPDSFSDGGDSFDVGDAVRRAKEMLQQGAKIIDIGGESTRPGAKEVPVDEEIARVLPVVKEMGAFDTLISIDTRKSRVVAALPQVSKARFLINDVSAMRFDPEMAVTVARAGLPVCLMHSVADPETMQDHARYDDVLLDVYDHLEERIAFAEEAGIQRDQIIVDPGIGFGKTLEHNLVLLRGLALFHSLGCPILLGASRKRFIGTLGNAEDPKNRLGGSVSVALHGVSQGVQILRVHDTFATKQAVDLQMAINGRHEHDT